MRIWQTLHFHVEVSSFRQICEGLSFIVFMWLETLINVTLHEVSTYVRLLYWGFTESTDRTRLSHCERESLKWWKTEITAKGVYLLTIL